MDMSFALQALSTQYLLGKKLEPAVHNVPGDIDRYVAELKLNAMGIEIDDLTPRQAEYLEAWEEGT